MTKRGGEEEGMKLSHFSRGDTFVSDTALTGVNGTHVSDSDYPQGKYIVYLCKAQMYSLYISQNRLLKAKEDKSSRIYQDIQELN